MAFFTTANRRDVDMRTECAILLRERDPLAVGCDRDRPDPVHVARADSRRFAISDRIAVELFVRGGVEQRLRVWRPDERALLVIEVRDPLRRLAFRIADPDFVA